jgi:hypothetical protein
VIPALVFVSIFVIAYVRFLIHLNPRSRWMFILSGAIYVGGALFVEMAAGAVESHHGTNQTATYVLLVTVEEVMEMAGITLLVFAILQHIQLEWGGIAVVLSHAQPGAREAPLTPPRRNPAAIPPAAPARPAFATRPGA